MLAIVGRVAGAHGIRGEVRVAVLADGPEVLFAAKRFALSRTGPGDPSPSWIENEGGSKGRPGEVRLALRGVVDRDAADALRGTLLLVDANDLPLLPPGQHYRFELIGCVVESSSGERVGVVSGLLDTGAAHDVLTVDGDDGKQRLIPMVGALMRKVDVPAKRIVLEDIAGLTDPA